MNPTARIQSWAGGATLVALPLLYIGGTQRIGWLTVVGIAVFSIGMLITPILRFLPQRSEPARGTGNKQAAKHRAGEGQAAATPDTGQSR